MFIPPIPVLSAYATGSSVICPEVGPNDDDVVVLVRSMTESAQQLLDALWAVEADMQYNGGPVSFFSARSDNRNLIVTDSPELFDRFVAATRVAKALHLVQKKDRIVLFQYVLYGNLPNE